MDALENGPNLSKSKEILFFSIGFFLIALVMFIGGEVALRLMGYEPWRPKENHLQVTPGGGFYRKEPRLGYTHIPGKFQVTLPTDYSFNVTHLPNTLRITHPLESYDEKKHKDEIWIFGCSFTHGWSLNDEETYPWLLQQRFPTAEVVNFGVGGYGTVHSMIQFKQALEVSRPKVVVLAYAGFHDERNLFLRSRAKTIVPYNKLVPMEMPCARIDRAGVLHFSMAKVEYAELPFMRYSALMDFIDMKLNRVEYRFCRSHAVSEALVKEMERIAREHQIKFVVVGISQEPNTLAMMRFAQEQGIPSLDISVDDRIKENSNAPHDSHPSAIANRKYADKIESFLKADRYF